MKETRPSMTTWSTLRNCIWLQTQWEWFATAKVTSQVTRSSGSTVQRWGPAFSTCTSSTISKRFSSCHTNWSHEPERTEKKKQRKKRTKTLEITALEILALSVCDTKDALCGRMSHTHSHTSETKSLYQQRCQRTIRCHFWQSPGSHEASVCDSSAVVSKGFTLTMCF